MADDDELEQTSAGPGPAGDRSAAGFDLGALVRRIAAEHADVADPRAVAAEVLAQLPVAAYPAVVAQLLPRYVGDALRREQPAAGDVDAEGAWDQLLTDRVPTPAG